jgi:hypothetical protein
MISSIAMIKIIATAGDMPRRESDFATDAAPVGVGAILSELWEE